MVRDPDLTHFAAHGVAVIFCACNLDPQST